MHTMRVRQTFLPMRTQTAHQLFLSKEYKYKAPLIALFSNKQAWSQSQFTSTNKLKVVQVGSNTEQFQKAPKAVCGKDQTKTKQTRLPRKVQVEFKTSNKQVALEGFICHATIQYIEGTGDYPTSINSWEQGAFGIFIALQEALVGTQKIK